jgi:hippurate hydrolase
MIDLDALQNEMTSWRRELHRHPEFGFEEKRTAAFVAAKLRAFGLDDVVEAVGGTGVVATLRRGRGNRSIALRADMDALRIEEQGDREYKSQNRGIMHACGHDGHTAMLLGSAKLLSENGGFEGTVRFVFQPAEEWGRGALAMLADGLTERFSFDEIYGLHNMPGYPVGQFRVRPGAMMAAEDNFEIALRGVGGHASRPHVGSETLVGACALVLNLQTIVSRRIDPSATAVVSVTELITDGARNVLPGLARVLGDVRSFSPEISAAIEHQMRMIAEGAARAHNLSFELTYTREFVPLINDAACTAEAIAAAGEALGAENVEIADAPITASEDFAHFLGRVPGCFAFLGAGVNCPSLHNPLYDFNDEILLDGVRFYEAIVRRRLQSANC